MGAKQVHNGPTRPSDTQLTSAIFELDYAARLARRSAAAGRPGEAEHAQDLDAVRTWLEAVRMRSEPDPE